MFERLSLIVEKVFTGSEISEIYFPCQMTLCAIHFDNFSNSGEIYGVIGHKLSHAEDNLIHVYLFKCKTFEEFNTAVLATAPTSEQSELFCAAGRISMNIFTKGCKVFFN